MNVPEKEDVKAVPETKYRPIYRNAFRQAMVNLYESTKVNIESYPYFEIKQPTEPKAGGSKFIITYSDPEHKTITIPMPDNLTDDVTLSDTDWVIAGATLLAECRKCGFNNVTKKRFIAHVKAYINDIIAQQQQ